MAGGLLMKERDFIFGRFRKPEGYDDLFVFIPDEKQIIRIAEGTGDNLLPEDSRQGYTDYIYFDQHALEDDMPLEDGGQIMLDQPLRDKYGCLADCIPDVLQMAYGSTAKQCIILG